MVLGLRTKTRKGTPVHTEYVFHIVDIKPWPPSQSLKSVRSVLLQWENGERHSGYTKKVVPSIGSGSDGKIEFNESFRLPVTLLHELSVKGVELDIFQRNCLELNLYEPRRDKIVKGQLLGTILIDLAEYGLIKDPINITAPMNCKRSYRNTSQPMLHMKIQPYERDNGSSSSRDSVPKGILSDKDGKESVSALMSEEYAEEAEIASFTDDDISSQCSQTSLSKSPPYSAENTDIVSRKSEDSWSVRNLDEEVLNAKKSSEDSAKVDKKNDFLVKEVQAQIDLNLSMKVNGTSNSNEAFTPDHRKSSKMTLEEVSLGSECPEINGQSESAHLKQNVTTISDILLAIRTGSLLSDTDNVDTEARLANSMNVVNARVVSEGTPGQSNDIASGTPVVPKDFDKDVEKGIAASKMPENQMTAKSDSRKDHEHKNCREEPCSTGLEMGDNRTIGNGVNAKVVVQKAPGDNDKTVMHTEVVLEVHDHKERGKGPADTGLDNAHNHINADSLISKGMMQNAPGDNSKIVSGNSVRPKCYDYKEGGECPSMVSEMSDNQITANNPATKMMVLEAAGDKSDIASGTTVGQKSYDCKEGGRILAGSDMFSNGVIADIGDLKVEEEAEEKEERNTVEGGENNKGVQTDSLVLAEIISFSNGDGENADECNKSAAEGGDTVHADVTSDDEEAIHHSSETSEGLELNGELCDGTYTNSSVKSMEGETSDDQLFKVSQGTHRNQVSSCVNKEVPDGDGSREACETVCNSKLQGLEHRIEELESELREAAELEVALYSIVAEHGSSVHKVHTPARRLSRMYIHAYRNWSKEKRASAARSMVSGLVLVAKACGNDVARLMYWLSNAVVLRTIISQGFGDSGMRSENGPQIDTTGNRKGKISSLKWRDTFIDKKKDISLFSPMLVEWQDPNTFTAAIEKIESWIFSQIIKSIWWQTLTLYMQYPVDEKNVQLRKFVGKMSNSAADLGGSFSISLWKKAFQDAFERLCPVRAAGHECGCLPLLAKLVMEQCVVWLDIAMFNAILRESPDGIPTDPISDPIIGFKVLPISPGNLSFGVGVQLKNSIGTWSRWLTDLFGIDDDDSLEDMNCYDDGRQDSATSFKSFHLLNALSDLLMLPKDMLLDASIRKEVCPTFAAPLIKRILWKFVPDEFCPDQVPEAVLEALDSENVQNLLNEQLPSAGTEQITCYPCSASPIKYSPPRASSVSAVIGDVQSHIKLKKNTSLVLRKCHISDDELDELDSPLTSIIDKVPASPSKDPAAGPILPEDNSTSGRGNTTRYHLLREWENGERHSGYTKKVVPSIGSGSDGKIEFNESPVTLLHELSVKGVELDIFQRNCLELNLYEPRRDKIVKGQLLGTVLIYLAEYGLIKDPINITAPMNCKRSYRNTYQPMLHMKIQPYERDCGSSSSRDSVPKGFSSDKDGKESVSALMSEGYAEEAEIASFTDDDISSQCSQTSLPNGLKHRNKSVRTVHDNSTSMTLGNTDLFVQKRAASSSKRNSNRTRRCEKMHSRSGAAEVDGSREACETVCNSKLQGLAHRIEELESELREAAELEVALYSIVAEHGSSVHKVHTPARRLSRMYIHAYRNWSKEKRASAARSMVSGLVLVAKACGNDVARQNTATSFKSFHLLNALSDLLMLPKDMLLDASIKKEVCPTFAAPLIKRILWKFVPDEFCPDQVPEAVLEALDSEVSTSLNNLPGHYVHILFSPVFDTDAYGRIPRYAGPSQHPIQEKACHYAMST
ncbi:hypothetical protein EJ110_NYTH32311 [Nymphaea thermarum]|nr:hypothetical protein EJ110_NYTH32311 [Nymphaea thermarum]